MDHELNKGASSMVLDLLEDLYSRYNRPEYIKPDPLEKLFLYDDPFDREVVGLIASSLAYGRVAQILSSVSFVLDEMGESPRDYLLGATVESMQMSFGAFKHRFTTGSELVEMFCGMKRVILEYGSLQACFVKCMEYGDGGVQDALVEFVSRLYCGCGRQGSSLIACPAKKSACKRLHLFLRWMVRCDSVDPGGWCDISPAKLVVPLDTHMHGFALGIGATRRRQADLAAALEVTEFFRKLNPGDPVKYDFSITRFGIRQERGLSNLVGKIVNAKGTSE